MKKSRDCVVTDVIINSNKIINFGETLPIFGAAKITPHSSAFSIGACNWLIEIDSRRVAYLNDHTSLRYEAFIKIIFIFEFLWANSFFAAYVLAIFEQD